MKSSVRVEKTSKGPRFKRGQGDPWEVFADGHQSRSTDC